MDSGNVSAIIAACAGIGGVLLGNSFLTIKEVVASHFKRKKDAEYLAIIVVSHLDRFATGCLQVAYDDGTEEGRPAGNNGSYWAPTTKPPTLEPLDIKVEWKSLPRDLMYAVLQIPDKQEHLSHELSGVYEFDDFPEYTEYFRARRHGYAELGLEVSEVARKLRKHARMPIEKLVPGVWNREIALREAMEKIIEERAAYKKRVDEYQKAQAALSAIPT
ncbi:hypothetical protein SAMN05518854_1226 [Variovorax sp. YR266]|nr:hypothetical protein SAMN05518854_1226 [Variovorax sp. YR266]